MKGTKAFQETISQYLISRAENDPILSIKLANPSKSMEQCCTFIINEVKKSGCCGFSDDEIFGWAMHYWDEPEIEVGRPVNCKVVVNHVVELTEEEKAEARERAINQLCEEEKARLRRPSQHRKATSESDNTIQSPSLFGEDF